MKNQLIIHLEVWRTRTRYELRTSTFEQRLIGKKETSKINHEICDILAS